MPNLGSTSSIGRWIRWSICLAQPVWRHNVRFYDHCGLRPYGRSVSISFYWIPTTTLCSFSSRSTNLPFDYLSLSLLFLFHLSLSTLFNSAVDRFLLFFFFFIFYLSVVRLHHLSEKRKNRLNWRTKTCLKHIRSQSIEAPPRPNLVFMFLSEYNFLLYFSFLYG